MRLRVLRDFVAPGAAGEAAAADSAADLPGARRHAEDRRQAGGHQGRRAARLRHAARPARRRFPVQGKVPLVAGAGGNIAVQVSDEGTLLVDSGDAAATEKVLAEIQKLKVRPVRWILNTSSDLDHTGGNATIAKTGTANAVGGGAGNNGAGRRDGVQRRPRGHPRVSEHAQPHERADGQDGVAGGPTTGRPTRSSRSARTSGTAASRSRCGTSPTRTATATSSSSSASRTSSWPATSSPPIGIPTSTRRTAARFRASSTA